ncbi:MAG: hypothetical protein JJE53_03415, partial [Candidatus Pacebacteria bacterium]|nr:hypothetical protein [Candidatus Paceibacterota bacterium]
PFVFWNILSSIAWAILNVFLGYFSGSLVVRIFKNWSSGLSLIFIVITITVLFYWFIKKKDHSLKNSFRTGSLSFIEYLKNKNWFKKLISKYPFISLYIKESKNAAEKIFGSVLIFIFLISTYLLILILDVF